MLSKDYKNALDSLAGDDTDTEVIVRRTQLTQYYNTCLQAGFPPTVKQKHLLRWFQVSIQSGDMNDEVLSKFFSTPAFVERLLLGKGSENYQSASHRKKYLEEGRKFTESLFHAGSEQKFHSGEKKREGVDYAAIAENRAPFSKVKRAVATYLYREVKGEEDSKKDRQILIEQMNLTLHERWEEFKKVWDIAIQKQIESDMDIDDHNLAAEPTDQKPYTDQLKGLVSEGMNVTKKYFKVRSLVFPIFLNPLPSWLTNEDLIRLMVCEATTFENLLFDKTRADSGLMQNGFVERIAEYSHHGHLVEDLKQAVIDNHLHGDTLQSANAFIDKIQKNEYLWLRDKDFEKKVAENPQFYAEMLFERKEDDIVRVKNESLAERFKTTPNFLADFIKATYYFDAAELKPIYSFINQLIYWEVATLSKEDLVKFLVTDAEFAAKLLFEVKDEKIIGVQSEGLMLLLKNYDGDFFADIQTAMKKHRLKGDQLEALEDLVSHLQTKANLAKPLAPKVDEPSRVPEKKLSEEEVFALIKEAFPEKYAFIADEIIKTYEAQHKDTGLIKFPVSDAVVPGLKKFIEDAVLLNAFASSEEQMKIQEQIASRLRQFVPTHTAIAAAETIYINAPHHLKPVVVEEPKPAIREKSSATEKPKPVKKIKTAAIPKPIKQPELAPLKPLPGPSVERVIWKKEELKDIKLADPDLVTDPKAKIEMMNGLARGDVAFNELTDQGTSFIEQHTKNDLYQITCQTVPKKKGTQWVGITKIPNDEYLLYTYAQMQKCKTAIAGGKDMFVSINTPDDLLRQSYILCAALFQLPIRGEEPANTAQVKAVQARITALQSPPKKLSLFARMKKLLLPRAHKKEISAEPKTFTSTKKIAKSLGIQDVSPMSAVEILCATVHADVQKYREQSKLSPDAEKIARFKLMEDHHLLEKLRAKPSETTENIAMIDAVLQQILFVLPKTEVLHEQNVMKQMPTRRPR